MVLISITVLIIKIIWDLSYTGTKDVLIIDNYDEINSLDELINLPEFDNKFLYINLYNLYCSVSINEFVPLKKIIAKSQQKDTVFIHLATPKLTFTNNWKSTLPGYNMLMNSEFYSEFWSHFPNRIGRYTPFYLIVSKDKIISQTNRPSFAIAF